MTAKVRKSVNWVKTGKVLQLLRNDNLNLRRYVCGLLKLSKVKCNENCAECKLEMDSVISRPELAKVFKVSDTVLYNWETGKTPVSVEDLLFYCDITGLSLDDILQYN